MLLHGIFAVLEFFEASQHLLMKIGDILGQLDVFLRLYPKAPDRVLDLLEYVLTIADGLGHVPSALVVFVHVGDPDRVRLSEAIDHILQGLVNVLPDMCEDPIGRVLGTVRKSPLGSTEITIYVLDNLCA